MVEISKYPKSVQQSILELNFAGKSSRFIAKTLEISKSGVNNYLRKVREGLIRVPLMYDPRSVALKPFSEIDWKPQVTKKVVDNSRILIISDLHIPYHHQDALAFLEHLKNKYQPTRIICMGDELDKHSLSFHDSDPDLASAGDELSKSLPVISKLQEMFPVMDILDSNHGSLVYRKAKHHGIPKAYVKDYNDVLGVGEGWKWNFDLTIQLPNGTSCYFHHGKVSDVKKLSQMMGMSAVQGHFHETFKIDYWGNPVNLLFAMQTGCLIDDSSLAFSYNNVNIKRPIIGTGLIIDSIPVLEPMIIKNGRWIGA